VIHKLSIRSEFITFCQEEEGEVELAGAGRREDMQQDVLPVSPRHKLAAGVRTNLFFVS
jgi:hypothetical protein